MVKERHKEEMARMQEIQLQSRPAEQKQVSGRAAGSAVPQQVVSALVAFPLQSSRMGAMALTAMLCALHHSCSEGHLVGH